MSTYIVRTLFVCLVQIKFLCFVFCSTSWSEESQIKEFVTRSHDSIGIAKKFGASGRPNANPLGRKVLSHPSQYDASLFTDTDDFLSVINRRKLLSSYSSCGCSDSCSSGTVYVGYTYNGCSGCCSNSWGTCDWWGNGKEYKSECAECDSNSDCDAREYCSSGNSCYSCHSSCKTCTTYGSGGCASCYSGTYLDAGWWSNDDYCKSCHSNCKTCTGYGSGRCDSCYSGTYLSQGLGLESLGFHDDYCVECTSNSHCSGNKICSSNTCSSCHSTCNTCDSTGSSDCLSCPSGKYLSYDYLGLGSSGYCVECTQNSHCGTGEICSSNTCSSCHSTCNTCDSTGSSDCLSCPSGKYLSYDYLGLGSSGYCVECTQNSHCGSGEICSSNTCSSCHSTCTTCDGTGSSDCLTCPSGKHLKEDPWDLLGSSGSCKTCTEDSHCPGGSVCDASTLFTTGVHVCVLPEEDDGSWWCPEQDDNFWNFDMDVGTRGTYGFSQVYRMKVNGKTCSYNWVSEEFELQMQGNPKSESIIFSFSYGDYKDINLGIFTAEKLDGGLCAPIPALSFGAFGFGAGLYICIAIEKFDITEELMKGEIHVQLTAKVDMVVHKFEYDLNSQLLAAFDIDESDENIDLDALPTNLPVAYAVSACPSLCSSLRIGSAETCSTGVLSCQACDLAVCRTYLAEIDILEEGVLALSPPSSPNSPSAGLPNSPSAGQGGLMSGAAYRTLRCKFNLSFGVLSAILFTLMLA